jgi:hypothetical protein
MLIFALFVAIVADGISEKFDSLKKGKSAVSACRHGWHWAGMGGTGPAWVDSLKKRKSAVITTRLCT